MSGREGEEEERNDGEDRTLRGKGRRVMRSRLVYEWRGVVDSWLVGWSVGRSVGRLACLSVCLSVCWCFVPFQTRRKPRRQDFGVRLKSCRLNLCLPNQLSILHNLTLPTSLLAPYFLFKLSSFLRRSPSTSPRSVFHRQQSTSRQQKLRDFFFFFFFRLSLLLPLPLSLSHSLIHSLP